MKLQEVKDQYADSRGYVDWEDYYVNNLDESVEALVGEIAKLYAKAKMEEAADSLMHYLWNTPERKQLEDDMRNSITKTPLD